MSARSLPSVRLLALALAGVVGPLLATPAAAVVTTWVNDSGGSFNDPMSWDTLAVPGPADTAVIDFPGTYTVTVPSGVTVGGLTLGGPTGTQTLRLTSGAFVLDGPGTVGANGLLEIAGGTLQGTGELQVSGLLDWITGLMRGVGTTRVLAGGELRLTGTGAKTLDTGRQLVNEGAFNWIGTGTFNSEGSTTLLRNAPGGTIDLQVDAVLNEPCCGAPSVLQNEGLLKKTGGDAGVSNTTIEMALDNTGTVQVDQGRLRLSGGGTLGATATIAAGAFIDQTLGATSLADGLSVTGAGMLALSGGTWTVDGNVGVAGLSMSGGTLSGPGTLTVTRRWDWSGGTRQGTGSTLIPVGSVLDVQTAGIKTLDGGHLLDVSGTLEWTGTGTFAVDDETTLLRIRPGAVFDLQADALMDEPCCGTPPSLLVEGTLRKSAGTLPGSSRLEVPLQLVGLADVQQGRLRLDGGGSLEGTLDLAAGAEAELTFGTYTLEDGFTQTGAGVLRQVSGTVTVNAAVGVSRLESTGGTRNGTGALTVNDDWTWSAGTVSGAGSTVLPMGSTLALESGALKTLDQGHLVDLFGTGSWSGTGTISADDAGTTFRVRPGASLVVENDATFDDACCGGTPVLLVEGTLDKSAATSGLSHFDLDVRNEGTVRVLGGTVRLNGPGSGGGTVEVADGAEHQWSFGTHVLSPGFAATGAGRVRLSSSAVLDVSGGVSVERMTQDGGTLEGAGQLDATVSFDWNAGTQRGTGTTRIAPGATLLIDGAVAKFLQGGRELLVAGNATHQGTGAMFVRDPATRVRIGSGGSWDLASDAVIDEACCAGTPTFLVEGAVTKSVGAVESASVVDVAFDVAPGGTVELQQGRLRLTRGGTIEGLLTVLAGTTLQLESGTFGLSGANLAGAGLARLTGGVTDVLGPTSVANLEIAGGTLQGPATLSVTGSGTWTSGVQQGTGKTRVDPGATLDITGTGNKTIRGGRTLEIAGVTTWSGTGRLDADGDATTLHVLPGGVLDATEDAELTDACCGGDARLLVEGTLRKSAGAVTLIELSVEAPGTIDVQAGRLVTFGDGLLDGVATLAAGTELSQQGGGPSWSGWTVTGPGFVRVGGATASVDGASSVENLVVSSGTLTGPAPLSVPGMLQLEGGILTGAGTVRVEPAASLAITGTTNKTVRGGRILEIAGGGTWDGSGRLDVDDAATLLHVLPGGTLDLRSDAELNDACCGAVARLLVEGTLTKSATGGSAQLVDASVDNDGLVDVQVGTLQLRGGGASTGTFAVGAAGRLELAAGSDVWAGGVGVSGLGPAVVRGASLSVDGPVGVDVLEQSSGTVTGAGLLSVGTDFAWMGGTQDGLGTTRIEPAATLRFLGSLISTLRGGRTLEIAGTATHEGTARVDLDEAGTLVHVLPGGLLDWRTSESLNDACCGGVPSLLVEGRFLKSTDPGSAVIDPAIENRGTFEAAAGTLTLARDYVQTAGTTLLSGGDIDPNAGFELQGGTLEGNGSVTGSLDSTGATVSVGASAGRITVTGVYTQGADATLRVELGGPTPELEHDVLDVVGVANLDGTLEVVQLDGYEPVVGETFGILPFGVLSGGFASVVGQGFPGLSFTTAVTGDLLSAVAIAGDPPSLPVVDILNDPTAGAPTLDVFVRGVSGAATDVVSFEGRFDDEAPEEAQAFAADTPGPIVEQVLALDLTGLAPGAHELRVRAFDAQALASPESVVPFVVSSGLLPVVLVEGYDVSEPGPHPEQLFSLRDRLEDDGLTVFIAGGQDAWAAPEDNADGIAATVDAALAATGAPLVDVVAFDGGGFAARKYLDRGGTAFVRKLLLIAVPHEGSTLADDLFAVLSAAADDGVQAAIDRLAADRALPVRTSAGAALFDLTHRQPGELEPVQLVLLAGLRPLGPLAGTDDILALESALGLDGPNVSKRVFVSATAPAPLHRTILTDAAAYSEHVAPGLCLPESGEAGSEGGASLASARGGSRVGLARRSVRLSVELEQQPGGKFSGEAQVDDGDTVTIEALSADSDVDVTVTGPSGKTYTEDSTLTDADASGEGWTASGELASSSVTVTDPEPGTWTVEVETDGDLPPIGKFSQSGELQPAIVVGQAIHDRGEDVTVQLALGTSDAVVQGVDATLRGADGRVLPIALADDGAGADVAPGDGILTGKLTLPGDADAGGRWTVSASVSGSISGSAFARDAAGAFDVTTGKVALIGQPTDQLLDTDLDGTQDELQVQTLLSFAEEGNFTVAGTLDTPGGKFATDTTQRLEDVLVGQQAVDLAFAASSLGREGESGSYSLGKLTVFETSPGQSVAFFGSAVHATQSLDPAQLEQDGRPSFAFTSPSVPTPLTAAQVTLRWTDSDPDDDAVISLFRDDDQAGFDGVPIPGAGAISEDDETDAFVFDVGALPPGDWFVHATISDGQTARRVYAGGAVRVGLDSDGDGVSDADELALGTDPFANDTAADPDGDGLTTAREVALGTSPTLADTDGGGEGDGRELAAGRDPLVPGDDVDTQGITPGNVAPAGARDGQVNVLDVVRLLRLAVGLEVADAVDAVIGDVSPNVVVDAAAVPPRHVRRGDGRLDVLDVVANLQQAVGTIAIEELPPG